MRISTAYLACAHRPLINIRLCSDLVQSIPNLGKLVPSDGGRRDAMAMPQQLLHRSTFLLCKLIGAIATVDHPLVLVMDDLQWADATSLSVIQAIVTDPGEFDAVINEKGESYQPIVSDACDMGSLHFENRMMLPKLICIHLSISIQTFNTAFMLVAIVIMNHLHRQWKRC